MLRGKSLLRSPSGHGWGVVVPTELVRAAYFTPGHQGRLHPASTCSYGVACLEAFSCQNIGGGGEGKFYTLPPPPPLLVLTSLGALGPTSEELEATERVRQMYLFLIVLPPSAQWLCVDVTEGEWARYPYLRQRQLLTKHLCSFSSGSLSQVRKQRHQKGTVDTARPL